MIEMRVSVECLIDRHKDTVSIILADIPMEHLDQVLGEVGTESWSANVIDGIRAQYTAGPSLGLPRTQRTYLVDKEDDQ